MQEQEYEAYYLRDFVYFALKGWRKIVLFAVIGAILLTAVALLRNSNISEPEAAETEIVLTAEEIAAVRDSIIPADLDVIRYNQRITFLKENITALSERLSNSVYLSLDSEAQPVGTFVLDISMNNISNESEEFIRQRNLLLSLDYLRLARSNAFYSYLEKDSFATISGTNLRELVEISLQADNNVHFKFTGPDMTYVRQLSESAQEYIFFEAENQISYSYPHTLTITNENFRTINNPAIDRDRMSLETEIEELDQELDVITLELDELKQEIEETDVAIALEKALEEKIKTAEEAEKPEEEVVTGVNVPLYTIGGFIVGALVALLWNFYRGASAGKLLHPDDFSRRIGLLYINEIFVPEQLAGTKKSFAAALDRWIEHRYLAPKTRAADSLEESIDYAESIISGVYESREKEYEMSVRTIAVISADAPSVQHVIDAINQSKDEDSAKGFKLNSLGDNITDVSAIDALRAADAALVLVRPRKTEMQALLRALEITQELNKPILGLISVEEV